MSSKGHYTVNVTTGIVCILIRSTYKNGRRGWIVYPWIRRWSKKDAFFMYTEEVDSLDLEERKELITEPMKRGLKEIV